MVTKSQQRKLDLLYNGNPLRNHPLQGVLQSEEDLEKILVEGDGIYWELDWNDDATVILRVKPYPTTTVVANLFKQAVFTKEHALDDALYDFQVRSEWEQ